MVSWSTHRPPHKLIEGSPRLRQCRVSLKDLNEVEDIVTVSANSLFEAVALGLAQIKKNEWVADIATGLNVVTVKLPEASVKHWVVMQDFRK